MKEPITSPVYGYASPSLKEMEDELNKIDKEEQEKNLQKIKDQNKFAKQIIKKLSDPIKYELDEIEFSLKPISVGLWDTTEGEKNDPAFQTNVVKNSLLSPKLSDEEFDLLPAGLKYKLFIILLQDFFSTAGKVKKKN